MTSVKRSQIGGTHYKDVAIQPFEYIHKNNICYLEGTIKYVSRWRTRGGIQGWRRLFTPSWRISVSVGV